MRINTKHRIGPPSTLRLLALGGILSLGVAACAGSQPEPVHHGSLEEEENRHAFPNSAPNSQSVQSDPSATESKLRQPSSELPNAQTSEHGTQGSLDPTSMRTDSDAPKVSSDEIVAFSACLLRLGQLERRFEQRAQSGESHQALSQEFQQRALSIIEEEGLSPQRYEQIAQRVQQDPQLQEKVKEAMQVHGTG